MAPLRVSTIASVEALVARGVPAVVEITGAESVRSAPRMLSLMKGTLFAEDGKGDAAVDDAWEVVHLPQLRAVATLADHLLYLADTVIPELKLNPGDEEMLSLLNTTGKAIRKAGITLRDSYGLVVPGDAASLAVTLGNKLHSMVKEGFTKGRKGDADDRSRYIGLRLTNTLDQVTEVLGARIRFLAPPVAPQTNKAR